MQVNLRMLQVQQDQLANKEQPGEIWRCKESLSKRKLTSQLKRGRRVGEMKYEDAKEQVW